MSTVFPLCHLPPSPLAARLPTYLCLFFPQESTPSPVSAPLRTLGAAAEITRLTAHNVVLIVENERIPGLEAQLADAEEDKAELGEQVRGGG